MSFSAHCTEHGLAGCPYCFPKPELMDSKNQEIINLKNQVRELREILLCCEWRLSDSNISSNIKEVLEQTKGE